jgi:hypothetical protein
MMTAPVIDKNTVREQLQSYKDRMIASVQSCINEILVGENDQIIKDELIQIFQQWQKHITSSSMSIADFQGILGRFNRITMDIEMQRKKDNIEARILQYGAQLLLSQDAKNLLPLVLISICGWNNPEVIHDVVGSVLDGETNGAVPIFQETIYLQMASSPIGKDDSQRKASRKTIKDIFKTSLGRRYPELIKGGESFKKLWIQQGDDDAKTWIEKQNLRTAYEVLCFLRLAPLTPQLGGEGGDKDPNPANTKPLNDYQLRTRIFNPTIRKAYNLMNTKNVNTPGAQEQYLGVWSEQARIDELQQNAVDTLIDSLELIRFIPNEQKEEAITQWAKNTFLSSRNLGIRQATIDQIERRQGEFDAYVVDILREEYCKATSSGVPPTPIKREPETPRRDRDKVGTPPRPEKGRSHPSPMTPQGGELSSSSESDKMVRSTLFSKPAKSTSNKPPISPSPNNQTIKLVDQVITHLQKMRVSVDSEVKYIRGLNCTQSTLKAIASRISNETSVHQRKRTIFKQAANQVIKKQPR